MVAHIGPMLRTVLTFENVNVVPFYLFFHIFKNIHF